MIKLPKTKKVYVIGMAGLEEELRDEGIQVLGGTVMNVLRDHAPHPDERYLLQDPQDCTLESFDLGTFERDPDVGAVVCGLDTKINYTKLSKAYQYLLHDPACHFIATNEDSTYPSAHGLLPGAGSVSAPLRYALNKNPVCTGKPSSTMLDCIKAKYGSLLSS